MPATTTVVIIGAGHSGLANSWRTERWDSLRLLTPNWQTSLPGMRYGGDQPDGYMTAGEVATFVGDYAATIAAPVCTSATVTRVRAATNGYEVVTDGGRWGCAAVVIASGACNVAAVPASVASIPATITVHTPMTYKTPDQLDTSGVLVVGASATGVQLAEEIHRSGRPVTLAIGEHIRLPRTYRGRDIFWWTDAVGRLDERYDELDDVVRARHLPSPQLIGTPERRSIDINGLAGEGITIVGRLGRVVDGVAQFSGSLPNVCMLADLKMNRLLDGLDEWAGRAKPDVWPPERFEQTRVARPELEIDLHRAGIGTVLFATGYRPDYSWLDLPVLDGRGRIVHDGGAISGAPGCYVMGLNLLRRRRSSYINGANSDSADIARLIHRHLDSSVHPRRLVDRGSAAGDR